MIPNQPGRGQNDREASGSRVPTVAYVRGSPQSKIAGGTEISSDSQPLKLHFIMLNPGVDVIANIQGVAEMYNKGLVIISAIGTVSKAVMPQNASSPVLEGCFQIASMSGTCLPGEPTGKHGDITVLLSDRTGAVIGGAVDSLIADSKVQVVVASFSPDVAKPIGLKQEPDVKQEAV
ncbi:PREDICTED: AT-hook motif nuclear-localized protein 27-like [Tarenaya hassleriana]|uniref:AT-hook motif nuclear-localized protein 27-like n=1 Tax=Tarenaya hassleriana TaxID=28532 RepID=UPI00053C23CD|nr:PREDICTED: AT-hook motif nuclear-localized protein 27-like [Tarenaya hassleriana]